MKRYILIYNSVSVQFAISDEKKWRKKIRRKIFLGVQLVAQLAQWPSRLISPVLDGMGLILVRSGSILPLHCHTSLWGMLLGVGQENRGNGWGGGDLRVLWLAPCSLRQMSFHLRFPESQNSVWGINALLSNNITSRAATTLGHTAKKQTASALGCTVNKLLGQIIDH